MHISISKTETGAKRKDVEVNGQYVQYCMSSQLAVLGYTLHSAALT